MEFDGTLKNMRTFNKRVCKAAQDKNAGQMFFGNVTFGKEIDIANSIGKGKFKRALLEGFVWHQSKEGYAFWADVFNRITNVEETKKE